MKRSERKQAAVVSLSVAITGAVFFGALAFRLVLAPDYPNFGNDIYDRYFVAVLDGRLDLPVRVLRYEGHYRPDGTGYLYHGITPLMTRFAFGWLVPSGGASLAPFSVWLWAVIGTAAYHLAFLNAAKRVWPENGRHPAIWALLLAAAVWFGSPGVLLAANVSLYHEPIAVAYAATGVFVLLFTSAALAGRPMRWLLAALALLAAIALHSRPNVAIGLYLGTVVAVAHGLWQQRSSVVFPALLAVGILGVGGVGFLGLNELRFGSFVSAHGTLEESGSVYGTVFLGRETPDSPRNRAFTEHGNFNAKRILPNAGLYVLDPPGRQGSVLALHLFRAATEPWLGTIRVEAPRIGMSFLWMGWMVLGAAGLFSGAANRRLWILLLATATAALVTLAYGTITLRYRFDLWPVLAVLALSGLSAVVPRLATGAPRTAWSFVIIAATAAGLVVTASTLRSYTRNFQQSPGGFFGPWTIEHCVEILVEYQRFDDEKALALCRPPTG